MQNALLALVAAGSLALLSAPLYGQEDDTSAPPPPSDTAASAPDTGPAPTADQPTGPTAPITFQTFYDALEPMGTWINTSDYGYVWQPTVNDPDWAPYTNGHWVYSDDGWTWASDEPWGWATYHYGRWINLQNIGWVWVPGYTWAPAWVSWRYGDGYVAWAPLPPDSLAGIDYSNDSANDTADDDTGYHIGSDCDAYYGIGAAYYIFLPVQCLGFRHYHGYYCNRYDNYARIGHTTNVTNLNVARHGAGGELGRFHRVTAGGPSLANVNAASSTPVQQVKLVRTNQPGAGGTLTGQSFAVYAPHVRPGTDVQPTRVSRTIGQAAINHGTDILRPLAVNANLTPSAATENQVQQARISINHAPASAKIITDDSSVRPVLHAPLATLKPLTPPTVAPRTAGGPPLDEFSPAPRAPSTSTPGYNPTMRTYPQQFGQGMTPTRIYSPTPLRPASPPPASSAQP
jgi:hypothetical protein